MISSGLRRRLCHGLRHDYLCTNTATAYRLFSSNAARDTRVAGRRRFYLNVGMKPTAAPWQTTATAVATVDSGISAGVDGTPSGASGVSQKLEANAQVLQQLLIPQWPKSNAQGQGQALLDDNDLTWFTVTLDGRALKTPMGRTLAVPSSLLATALAAEWNSVTGKLNPTQMPLMTLVCTVLDQVSQPQVHQAIQADCMTYLATDTICYFADPLQDRVLHRRQEDHWMPVHDFLTNQLLGNHQPAIVYGAQEAMISAVQRRLPHPPGLAEQCRLLLSRLDAWHLQCLYSVCRESKSLLLGLAVLLDHYHENQSLQPAVEAARVEEEFQISIWGMVEGGHDYDRLNCAVQIQAATVLKDCLAIDCLKKSAG